MKSPPRGKNPQTNLVFNLDIYSKTGIILTTLLNCGFPLVKPFAWLFVLLCICYFEAGC